LAEERFKMLKVDGTCFRDHDFNLFIVLGYIHPPEESHAVLKYTTEEERDSKRFLQAQGIHDYVNALNFLKSKKPHLIKVSDFYSVDLLTIPYSDAEIIYDGVEKLRKVVKNPSSRIEKLCASFSEIVVENLGFKFEDMGVRGSILYGSPRPDSDIDITIFGKDKMRYFREHIDECPGITVMPLLEVERVSKFLKNISPLSMEEIVPHVAKRKTKLNIEGIPISIKCVRSEKEIEEDIPVFKTVSCKTLGPATVKGTVTDTSASLCYPVEYRIKDESPERNVEEILCLESLFAEFIEEDDTIEVKGVLQEVELDGRKRYRRIVISTVELAGKEYIKKIE
jgi:predicted nucleotidyltransferase